MVSFSVLFGHVLYQNRDYGSNSNLLRHVEACVGLCNDDDDDMIIPYSHAMFRYLLGEWMAHYNRPFSILDDRTFRMFLSHLID